MKRTIVWSPRAASDFLNQIQFIAADSAANAALVEDRIQKAVETLAMRQLGRSGRVPGTFEWSVAKTSLIISYRLIGETDLQIVRLIHTARDWKAGGWPQE
jgi:toxin ParE1/3/4